MKVGDIFYEDDFGKKIPYKVIAVNDNGTCVSRMVPLEERAALETKVETPKVETKVAPKAVAKTAAKKPAAKKK